LEIDRIALYGIENLTNMTHGGDGLSNPSKETREKMSRSQKKRFEDPEQKRIVSERSRGRVPFNKGKTAEELGISRWSHTPETIQKLKIIAKKRGVSAITREAQRATLTGKKRAPFTVETIEKMRKANLGKTISDEVKLKMSLSRMGRVPTLDTRKKLSEARKGFVFTDEHKRKISAGKKGQRISDDQKAFLRKIMKDRYNDKGMPKKMMLKGMKHTDENKRKMAERPCNHPNRRMVINMETGIFYDSAASAGASVGVKHPTVMYRIKKGIGSFLFV
jgi:hypothetical protein